MSLFSPKNVFDTQLPVPESHNDEVQGLAGFSPKAAARVYLPPKPHEESHCHKLSLDDVYDDTTERNANGSLPNGQNVHFQFGFNPN